MKGMRTAEWPSHNDYTKTVAVLWNVRRRPFQRADERWYTLSQRIGHGLGER